MKDTKNGVRWLLVFAEAVSVTVEVFFRRKFGSKYFGRASVIGMCIIPLWAPLCFPGHDQWPMVYFWWASLAMHMFAGTASPDRRHPNHSRYNGESRLTALFPRMDETKLKGTIEPFATIIIGIFMLGVSMPLGCYLIVAGFGTCACMGVIESVQQTKVQELEDAWIQQRLTAQAFRERQRRWRA